MNRGRNLAARLDPVIHERARLGILTWLASGEDLRGSFNEIKDALELSAGNLSVQMRRLEEAGFISVEKSFRQQKPFTELVLTTAGHQALGDYLDSIQALVENTSRPAPRESAPD